MKRQYIISWRYGDGARKLSLAAASCGLQPYARGLFGRNFVRGEAASQVLNGDKGRNAWEAKYRCFPRLLRAKRPRHEGVVMAETSEIDFRVKLIGGGGCREILAPRSKYRPWRARALVGAGRERACRIGVWPVAWRAPSRVLTRRHRAVRPPSHEIISRLHSAAAPRLLNAL